MEPSMPTKQYPCRPVRRAAGFTLIEILVVVVILGILAAFIVPNIMSHPEEARITKARSDIQALEAALDVYRLDNFNYPSTDQGLESLVSRPGGTPEASNWREGGYVKALREDPWGHPYRYLSPGSHGAIDIYSLGPDGVASTDDIGNWQAE
jgi:general secretion pathway protein G